MPRACLALCLVLLLPVGAAAQPVAPAAAPPVDLGTAQQLQQDLQSWFANLLGPRLGAQEQALRVTAEDDRFHVALPFANASGDTEVTADVRPLDGGRWSVDALHLPDKAHFMLKMPEPGGPPGSTVPTRLVVQIGSQHSHAIIDPAFATPSRLDIDLGDVGLTTDNARQHQEQRIDRYTLQATLTPRDGHIDLLQRGTLAGWHSTSRIAGKPPANFDAERIQASGAVDGIDRDRAATMLSAVGALIATLPASAAGPPQRTVLSAPGRAALRALIESFHGVATRLEGQETIDGLHVAVAGVGETTVRQVRLGLDGAAPDGILHATLTIAADGVTVVNGPPQAMELMPHHLLLQPSVAGVSLDDVRRLALAATDQNANPTLLAADATALLARGGATIGLEAFDLDIGPVELRGHAHLTLTGPGLYTLRAHITATGLDALMQQARGNPDLQRALPMLAMASGFAQPEGDHLIWDIVADKSGLSVNGVALGGPPAQMAHPQTPQSQTPQSQAPQTPMPQLRTPDPQTPQPERQ